MKIFLLTVVFFSCFSVGIIRSRALEKRRRSLADFIAFLDFSQTLLQTENPPTSEIIARSGFSLFDGVEPLPNAEKTYSEAIEKNLSRTGFSEGDTDLLNALFLEFGKTDGESQLSLVRSVRASAEKSLAEAEKNSEKYAKPYAVFGLLVGAALVIIFI